VVHATVDALKKLKSAEQHAARRGIQLPETKATQAPAQA
jgi:ribosomal protein S5